MGVDSSMAEAKSRELRRWTSDQARHLDRSLRSEVWQAFPCFNWQFCKWGSAQLGYRWLGTDYESGSGLSKFRYDVIVHGAQIGLIIRSEH
jgi:hypothetical protein